MPERRRGLRFLLFAIAVVVALIASFVLGVLQARSGGWLYAPVPSLAVAILVTLVLAVLFAGLQVVILPNAGEMSVSWPLVVAFVVFFGPVWAIAVAAADSVFEWFGRPDERLALKVFNTAQLCLTAVIPGLAYVWLGGKPLYIYPSFGAAAAAQPALALIAAGTIGTFVNLGLGAVGVSLYRSEDLRRVLGSFAPLMLPSQMALGLVGLAVAQVLASIGVPGFALFVIPLLVARQTYQRSEELRQAYADTIASLVAAIEAKDVYTKGHSVRVAKYAVGIARSLGMGEGRIGRLEWAALLHDIGKVGVSRRVLAKNAKLSNEEYDEIKRHPQIGAHILEDVQYLADLVPAIEAHHERLDGSGYGQGLSGDAIPLEARILAVADAYDAMTSTRPYRDAMPHEAAVAELLRGRGTQFDETVVEAFLEGAAEGQSAALGATSHEA